MRWLASAMTKRSPFMYFKTSPEIIRLAVMMYVRFPLSLRNVEGLLHERGIDVRMLNSSDDGQTLRQLKDSARAVRSPRLGSSGLRGLPGWMMLTWQLSAASTISR